MTESVRRLPRRAAVVDPILSSTRTKGLLRIDRQSDFPLHLSTVGVGMVRSLKVAGQALAVAARKDAGHA